jgi:two-component SAPR family response regulator
MASGAGTGSEGRARTALDLYRGRFAPEFEYEEWAIATRDTLHAAYLALVGETIRGLAESGDWVEAAEVARIALTVDPAADAIERNLIALYHWSGAHAAAAEQYSHYAAAQRADLGVEAPPLALLVSTPDPT